MEKITFFLGFFIFLFLIYSYIKLKKENKKKINQAQKQSSVHVREETKENYEKHVLSAVIAALMDGKKYRIRTIFKSKEERKKRSEWKISGRYYNMQRRDRV